MLFKIQTIGVNQNIGKDAIDILNIYGLIFNDYNKHIEHTTDKNFLEFLTEYSKDNYIANYIKETTFELSNFLGFYSKDYQTKITCKTLEYNNIELYGSFCINNEQLIHFLGSYIFLEDIKTKKQYVYYCD